ncbi:MAG: M64 family metallopeptidase [Bacteroidota bacterium]
MKNKFFLIMIISLLNIFSVKADFDTYFLYKTLRVDYYHTGNQKEEFYSIDEIMEEPFWGGSKTQLIDKFDFGKYKVMVFDTLENKLIYSRGFSSLFAEWIDTKEAQITTKSFQETFCLPFPKRTVRLEFYSRNKKNQWNKKFTYLIDPTNYFIKKENKFSFHSFLVSGKDKPANSLDIVIIPDGYTLAEMEKFRKDCNRFSEYLLNCNPYSNYKKSISIRAVEAPSVESGCDFPGLGIWKNTIVGSSFYTFDSERYLMTYEYKTIRSIAALVPYDEIVILVNTDHYGGGGIYNFYATCASDNLYSNYVFTHEFGHEFAGLGDEYYESDVSVQNFYPLDTEPWEPNLTTLVNFDSKWKKMLDKHTPIPTPVNDESKTKTGVFEGGGYMNKGVYRPFFDCSMKSIKYDAFCPVCKDAIIEMIEFYSK